MLQPELLGPGLAMLWQCRRSLFSNKEMVTILVWYVASCSLIGFDAVELPPVMYSSTDNAAVPVIVYISTIILYSILGIFADTFIGRYRLIQFSLWIQWITVLMSTLVTAMSGYLIEVHDHEWVQSLLLSILRIMELLGLSTFQVVAIQFGTDQLQGAPSDYLSAFIF